MRALGCRLAAWLRPGDLIILNGELGSGKTQLTQGIGRGLDVSGAIISPTFVLARMHRARGARPMLVHVDAYRLTRPAEVDDLDLDAYLAQAVTVVEWGRGLADHLSDDRLEIDITRADDPNDDTRTVVIRGCGARWGDADLTGLAASLAPGTGKPESTDAARGEPHAGGVTGATAGRGQTGGLVSGAEVASLPPAGGGEAHDLWIRAQERVNG